MSETREITPANWAIRASVLAAGTRLPKRRTVWGPQAGPASWYGHGAANDYDDHDTYADWWHRGGSEPAPGYRGMPYAAERHRHPDITRRHLGVWCKPGSIADSGYAYWVGVKSTTGGSAGGWGMCRWCEGHTWDEASRRRHLSDVRHLHVSHSKLSAIVSLCASRVGLCMSCSRVTLPAQRRFGYPICDNQECLDAWMFGTEILKREPWKVAKGQVLADLALPPGQRLLVREAFE